MSLRGQEETEINQEELDASTAEKAKMISPAKQSRFHNFSFPTTSWGNQRVLRCVNPINGVINDSSTVSNAGPWNLRSRRASCNAPLENRRSIFGGNEKRREFSVCLSREEIEEDFCAFKGLKPNRRPRKRAKIVQKQVDGLFPGLWLSEITADDYKVVE